MQTLNCFATLFLICSYLCKVSASTLTPVACRYLKAFVTFLSFSCNYSFLIWAPCICLSVSLPILSSVKLLSESSLDNLSLNSFSIAASFCLTYSSCFSKASLSILSSFFSAFSILQLFFYVQLALPLLQEAIFF